MSALTCKIYILISTLENGLYMGEVLRMPELSTVGDSKDKVINHLKTFAKKNLQEEKPNHFYQRLIHEPVNIAQLSMPFCPEKKLNHEDKSVELVFDYVYWTHDSISQLAYIPAFGIEVAAQRGGDTERMSASEIEELRSLKLKELKENIQKYIDTFIHINQIDQSNQELLLSQRFDSLDLHCEDIKVNYLSPKAKAIKEAEESDSKLVIEEVGDILSPRTNTQAYCRDLLVQDVIERIQSQSVLLIGAAGVGKSAIFYEALRHKSMTPLKDKPVWETNGTRLMAGMSGFGMWQKRVLTLVKEAQKYHAILFLGNLMELVEVGKSEGNSQGLASVLKRYIARGDVKVVVECTPQQKSLIEKADPQLLNYLSEIEVPETSESITKKVVECFLNDQAPIYQHTYDSSIAQMTVLLHKRYASYSANPGRPLRFLGRLLKYLPLASHLTDSTINQHFCRETQMPTFLIDETEPLNMQAVKEVFTQRLIGQTQAVQRVLDLIAAIKTRLTRPMKPIASLLFIGPTGVGKTELAKTLATFLFQNEDRLLRFDMSEFNTPASVNRLIGGVGLKEGLLTAKIREQPFSVLLLDEVEKAHPLFFDLLLQVLGEGRLTDRLGRLADFTNSLIIMTSNLGAQEFMKNSPGFSTSTSSNQEHFVKAVQAYFRSELYNRIDDIISFRSLTAEEIFKITQREFAQLQSREGLASRSVNFNYEDEVISYLANKGYHPKYGARPLKRLIEQELMMPLATELNQFSSELTLQIDVSLEQNKLVIDVKGLDKGARTELSYNSPLGLLLQRLTKCRREMNRLEHSGVFLQIQNQLFQANRVKKLLDAKKNWNSRRTQKELADPQKQELLKIRKRLLSVTKNLSSLAQAIYALEEEHMLTILHNQDINYDLLYGQLNDYDKSWHELLLETYSIGFKKPNEIIMAFFTYEHYAKSHQQLLMLTKTYISIAQKLGFKCRLHRLFTRSKEDIQAIHLKELEKPLSAKANSNFFVGYLLSITGAMAALHFTGEVGYHVVYDGQHVQGSSKYPKVDSIHYIQHSFQQIPAVLHQNNYSLPSSFDPMGKRPSQDELKAEILENKRQARRHYILNQKKPVVIDGQLDLSYEDYGLELSIELAMKETLKQELRKLYD